MLVFSQTDSKEKLTFDSCLYILEARRGTKSPVLSTRNGLCSTIRIGVVLFHEMLHHPGET